MSASMESRVIALAGLVQALAQVRRIADTGAADNTVLDTALGSVFRVDADSVEEVYGGLPSVRPGLRLLAEHLGSQQTGPKDQLLPKLAMSVMQLERNFSRNGAMLQKVHDGVGELQPLADDQGRTHPEVLAAVGKLYTQTLSHLTPRVMVQGNPHYLGQADVVAEIRAVLLAAVRSAVLWRQMGGSLWDFLLRRGEIRQTAEQLIRSL